MALHVPRAPGFAQMLKDGARHFVGQEEAVFRNIQACKQFVESIKKTYGPLGMKKIIINHIEKLFVTNDAATIVRELEVQHPAVKMLVLASQMQEQEVGDGTNFVIVFAGALLGAAEELLRLGLKPTEVIEGYEMALTETLRVLPSLVCDEVKTTDAVDDVVRAIRTSVMSKQYGNHDFIANLVAKACVSILPEKKTAFNVDNVRVCKILGSGVLSSQVVQGMVFCRNAEGTVNSADRAKIVVFTCPIDVAVTETKGTVLIKSAQELMDFSRGEEVRLEEQIKAIAATGAKVVVSGGKFGDMALHYVNKHGLMAVRLPSKFDVRRLCRTVGATALPQLTAPSAGELGYCDRVYVDELGGSTVVVFRQEATESRVATVVLRGSADNILDDMERAVDDGVNTFKVATKDGRLLAGAGACELQLSTHIAHYADSCSGIQQYPIRSFASALEAFPKLLADNCGADSTETLARLLVEHKSDNKHFGVNVAAGGGALRPEALSGAPDAEEVPLVVDARDAAIYDLFLNRSWSLRNAVHAACTVLSVDEIIMAKRSGGPNTSEKRDNPNWDD